MIEPEPCTNCERMIGPLETAYLWKDAPVCKNCRTLLETVARVHLWGEDQALAVAPETTVIVVVGHPFEKERGLRFPLYQCAGVKSGKRSGCSILTMPLHLAQQEGRTTCTFCAEGRTDDPFAPPDEQRRIESDLRNEADAALRKWPEFRDLHFGDNPPTLRQFAYAVSLGCKLGNGVTFESVGALIEEGRTTGATRKRNERPADWEIPIIYKTISERGPTLRELLKTIKRYHGVLPREVSQEEAQKVVTFLEDYKLPCPYCGFTIFADTDGCPACGKSLRRMRIPIELPDRGA